MKVDSLPPIELFINQLVSMTDQHGILEHCIFSTPDLKEGYSLDDNARALQVILRLPKNEVKAKELSSTYLKFILSARTANGFHNDLEQNFIWKNDDGIHESFGRAMAALGETASTSGNPQQQLTAAYVFDEMSSLITPSVIKSLSPRTIAQLIIAFSHRISFDNKFPSLINLLSLRKKLDNKIFFNNQKYCLQTLKELAENLISIYKKNSDKNWRWFEPIISYDNGRMPLSLFYAFQSTNQENYKKAGLESLDFLLFQTFNKKNDCFSFPGNKGWIVKGNKKTVFAQQPIEAGSTIEACIKAYQLSKKKEYFDFAKKAFSWYSGQNLLQLPLINKDQGGIYDGLEKWGINQNQGAESIITFLIGYLDILNADRTAAF